MAKSNKSSNFASQRNILNFRPNIHFVEPEQVEEDKLPSPEQPPTLDNIKLDVTNLISQYKEVENTANELQAEIDKRAGNLSIKLDSAHDSFVIAAVQRHFNDPKKIEITYDDYLECINHINETGAAQMPVVDQSDIVVATNDQYRDIFGSLGLPSGLGRPELSSHAQIVKPIDLAKFSGEQVVKLMELLTDPITKLIVKKIEDLNPF